MVSFWDFSERSIEELEGLNKSNKREMYSYLVMLLTHLLKWQYQPSLQSGNWEASIYISRKGIERVITDQPSLKNYWQEIVPKAYEEAKKLAQKETKLNFNLFPINPPYSINQLQDETWFP